MFNGFLMNGMTDRLFQGLKRQLMPHKPRIKSEREIERLYWSTPEVAAKLKERATTLRYWLKVFGDVEKGGRNRRFTREDIERLEKIKHLIRVEKYTLAGVKMKIKKP